MVIIISYKNLLIISYIKGGIGDGIPCFENQMKSKKFIGGV